MRAGTPEAPGLEPASKKTTPPGTRRRRTASNHCEPRVAVLDSFLMHRSVAFRRLALLIVCAFALRMAYCMATGTLGRTGPGYAEYIVTAERLLEHGTLTSPLITGETDMRPSALLPPAYTAFVAAVYSLFGVKTFAATLVLQAVNAAATSLTVLLVFLVVREIASLRAAWIAALVATVNPTLFGFTSYIWDTSLFALGTILAVWISLRLSAPRTGSLEWLAYGVFLGALALLNPAMTITYPFLVLWPLVRSRGRPFGFMLRPVLLAMCGWLTAIMPWTVRNYAHFDTLIYIRSGFMHELWLGVCPEADSNAAAVYTRQYPLLSEDAQQKVVTIGEPAFLSECGNRAIAAISHDPGRFVRLCAVRTVDYWLGTAYTHAPPGGGGWPRSTSRAVVIGFLSLEVLSVMACLLFGPRVGGDTRWLLGILLAFSLVYCITHVQLRYRTPVETLFAVVAAILLTETGRTWLSRRHRSTVQDNATQQP